jgi:hypothetical protein
MPGKWLFEITGNELSGFSRLVPARHVVVTVAARGAIAVL